MEKKTLGWAVLFMEMLNFLPLGTSVCLHPPASTCAPKLVHAIVHPELLQIHDLPHCLARSPSKQRPGGEVLSQLSNVLLSYASLIWERKHRKPLAFRKELPTRKAALSHPHPPQRSYAIALLTAWLCHHAAQMSGAGRSGWGLWGEKAETQETSIHWTCFISSRQGVNAGLSPHTGVMSQGRD